MSDPRDRFRSLDRQEAPDLWSDATARANAAPQGSWRPGPRWAVAAVTVVVLGVFVAIQLIGSPLIAGPGPSGSPPAFPSASEPAPSAVPPAEPSAEPSVDAEEPFVCDLPITLAAEGSDFHPLITQDLRLGTHDGYDRIVLEYDGGTPYLALNLAEPPFVQDPSGLPIEVSGTPVYSITLTGATKYDQETGEQPYQGPVDFQPGYEQIVQFVEFGDFEATHNWYLGLNGPTCLRAFTLTDPSRLVIDVQHAPPSTATTADGDFQLTIAAPRTTWRSDEAIELGATLAYFGSPAETTLYGSGTGLIGFSLTELTGEQRSMGAAYNSDCAPHPIATDDPIATAYQKSGGYSPDEPDAAFWEAFFADPEFHLPSGQWRVTAGAGFGVGACGPAFEQLDASLLLTIE